MKYVVRNNQVEQVWRIEYENKMFQQIILVRGTEDEVREYMDSEMGFMGKYHALTESEIQAAHKLDIKIYIAPKL